MQALHLRRAASADAAAILALTRAAYAQWVPVIGREPKPMVADYAAAARDHLIDLWEKESQLLALIEMVPTPDHLLIENIAVSPDHQGKGLGHRLLEHADGVGRSLGLSEMRLYTNAAFTENLTFYAKRGFEIFLREPIATGGEAVHMKKTVSANTDVAQN